MNVTSDRPTRARKDLSSFFEGLKGGFKLSNPNGDSTKKVLVIGLPSTSPREYKGKHNAALARDEELVAVRVIFDERDVAGTPKVRAIVHGVLEGDIGSYDAVKRAGKLYDILYAWMNERAESFEEEYATNGSPQRRYFMRE